MLALYDYHDLHVKSTTAMKSFGLTLSGRHRYEQEEIATLVDAALPWFICIVPSSLQQEH
jgi:hypothetical protein